MNTRKITDRRYNTRYAFQCHDQSQSGFIGSIGRNTRLPLNKQSRFTCL
ncbi:Uncharacterised protein [Vibrio cholerae]|nr:Uncharacterised protein [Vibrio cholerae]